MYRFHRSLKIVIIDNIFVDWQSSKKVISFPTLVISFVKSYQFSDTCHSNNSSHISDQCGQKKFIYFCWPIIFYSWYIFWYHMGLGTSKNIIIYLWFTLKVMYPNEACYTYQFCEIFSIQYFMEFFSHFIVFYGILVTNTQCEEDHNKSSL